MTQVIIEHEWCRIVQNTFTPVPTELIRPTKLPEIGSKFMLIYSKHLFNYASKQIAYLICIEESLNKVYPLIKNCSTFIDMYNTSKTKFTFKLRMCGVNV